MRASEGRPRPTRVRGPRIQRQRGIALFISLAILMLLTLAGVAAVQATQLQARMARNAHDNLIAFQAAEMALLEAERFLSSASLDAARFTAAGADGLWRPAAFGDAPVWETEAVWADAGGGSRVAAPAAGAVAPPRYLIEWLTTLSGADNPHLLDQSTLGDPPQTAIFRITARGFGATVHAQTQLQSTFAVRLPPENGS